MFPCDFMTDPFHMTPPKYSDKLLIKANWRWVSIETELQNITVSLETKGCSLRHLEVKATKYGLNWKCKSESPHCTEPKFWDALLSIQTPHSRTEVAKLFILCVHRSSQADEHLHHDLGSLSPSPSAESWKKIQPPTIRTCHCSWMKPGCYTKKTKGRNHIFLKKNQE